MNLELQVVVAHLILVSTKVHPSPAHNLQLKIPTKLDILDLQ